MTLPQSTDQSIDIFARWTNEMNSGVIPPLTEDELREMWQLVLSLVPTGQWNGLNVKFVTTIRRLMAEIDRLKFTEAFKRFKQSRNS